jgi:phosphatidylserine/phosphatidylglycerophosphate/cardiolipin synthase-like enzyme
VLDAIAGAKKSIRMMMFHLTVPDVEAALVAAKGRGVDVQIILDGKSLESRGYGAVAQRLVDHGIVITKSSPAFSITHVKAMVIDDARAIVMSLNLTRPYDHTRDYAIVTDDRDVVDEFLRVFRADVENAEQKTGNTPPLASAALVWSPIDSEARLVALVDSARASIAASTENLGDKPLQEAFARAAKRGVKVRIVAPMCDQGDSPLRNLKFVDELDKTNVDARVMPPPSTREQPYVHAKMMIIDGARGFVGSINFSENSMKHARELGIVFDDRAAVSAFSNVFESDWRYAVPPPPKTGATNEHKGEWKTDVLCGKREAQTALPME